MKSNNKKIVKFNGGLGNQMFQYAFALALAKKFGSSPILDFSWFRDVKYHTLVVPRKFELGVFNTQIEVAAKEDLVNVRRPDFSSKIKNSLAKMFPKFFNVNYVSEKHTFCFDKKLLNCPHYFFYDGYFQNEKYFKSLREDLLKDFSLKESFAQLNAPNQNILNQIKNTNSISLHIRRGDYISLEHVNNTHGICSLEYYKKAIDYITSKIKNPHFYIFSDDINWVKENLKIDYPYTIVDFNQGKSYCDLELMRNCKNNITANSSFSWWAAWLNENPEKIVISPKKWLAKKQKCDIVPKEWVKL